MWSASQLAHAWIDESAGKGLVRNLSTQSDSDIALVAALVVPVERAVTLRDILQDPFDRFAAAAPTGVKLHITDAFKAGNEAWREVAIVVRDDILNLLIDAEAPIVYAARRFALARVAHEASARHQAESSEKLAQTRPELDVKHRPSRDRVEVEALRDLVYLLDCFGKDHQCQIELRSDSLDRAIADDYETTVRTARQATSSAYTAKAFNRATGQPEERSFRVDIEIPGWSDDDINITHVQPIVTVETTVCPELLAIDIVASVLAYHLKSLPSGAELYGPAATATWRYANLVWGSNSDSLDTFNRL